MILASSSLQRHQLIKYVTYETKCLSVEVDETFDEKLDVYENIKEVAKKKALAVIEEYNIQNDLVIGADTIVCLGEKVLLKPKDYDDAYSMIKSYSENDTEIVSGVCVAYVKNGVVNAETFVDTSWVTFGQITDENIKAWLAEDDYLTCSGAIKIEKVQKYFKSEIAGSVSNIIGLPLEKLTSLYLAHIKDDRFKTIHEDQLTTPLTRARSTSRVIPVEDGHIYLLKQVDRTNDEGYVLLGGGCTLDEEILEAGKREVLEEAGLIVENLKPLTVAYVYHERKDEFLGIDRYWLHQFMSYGEVKGFVEAEPLEYEKDIFKGVVKVSLDEAIEIFENQEIKYENAENAFFAWFNRGVADTLKIVKSELEKK